MVINAKRYNQIKDIFPGQWLDTIEQILERGELDAIFLLKNDKTRPRRICIQRC